MTNKLMQHLPLLLAFINTLMCFENLTLTIFLYALTILFLVIVAQGKISRPIIFILNFLSLVFIIKEYRTIFDIEAGSSWLILLANLKLLETKNARDRETFYAMILIASIAQILFTQSIIGSFFYLTTTVFVFVGLFQHNNPGNRRFLWSDWVPILKFSLLLVPIIITSYFVFPRFELGFSFFRQNAGRSGFSPDINLQQTGEIQLSDRAVFKVEFKQNIPNMNERYWIGNILYYTNGNEWLNQAPYIFDRTFESNKQPTAAFNYQVVMQNVSNTHLFLLDAPIAKITLPAYYEPTSHKSYKLIRTHLNKISYTVQTKEFEEYVKSIDLTKYLKLPKKLSPIIRDTAKQIKGEDYTTSVKNLNNYFLNSGFTYTLSPPPSNTLDKFLENKKGFCVHFAAAYATLAREMGIPSRILVGFQGGDENPYDNIITIREKDAHAWVELFNEVQSKWIRVDPVYFVAPDRINSGITGYETNIATEGVFAGLRNIKIFSSIVNYLRHLDNRWQTFVYSFDTSLQERLADRLGLSLEILYQLSILIPVFFLLFIAIYLFIKNKSIDDPIQLAFSKMQNKIKKPRLKKNSWEGFLEYFNRINLNENASVPKRLCDYFYSSKPMNNEEVKKLSNDIEQLNI